MVLSRLVAGDMKWADLRDPWEKLWKKLLIIILSFQLQMTESTITTGSREHIHLEGGGGHSGGQAGWHIWKLFVWF